MTVQEARALTEGNTYRTIAINYAISTIESTIRSRAEKGARSCIVDFMWHPNGFNKFIEQFGEDQKDRYVPFNVEQEVKEHFTRNGFSFKYVTDDICGGVRQDPYWIICW